MRRRAFLASGLAACAPGSALAAGPPMPPPISALEHLPLTLAGGARTTLGAHLGPGPSVVSFWASWCAPCVAEARHLARLRATVAPERLNIVGINIDVPAEDAEIARFLQLTRANYTQLRGDFTTYVAFDSGAAISLPRLHLFAADGAPAAVFDRFNAAASAEISRMVTGLLRR
jgi:thiol-disulfide isomerase/thioredoxin